MQNNAFTNYEANSSYNKFVKKKIFLLFFYVEKIF